MAVELSPLIDLDYIEQRRLQFRLLQESLPPFKRGADGGGARRHQPLHQDHEEPDVALLGGHGLIVAVTHVVGHSFVELLLGGMTILPGHRLKTRHTRLEKRPPLRVDGGAFFGPDYVRRHPFAADAALVGEGIPVDKLHQTQKLVGLSLVRGRRKQQ